MLNYAATRGVGKFVAFVGWIAVAASALVLISALLAMHSGFGLLALGPAFGLAIGGLLLVVQGQLTQAFADTAMNTGTLVELMRGNRSLLQPQQSGAPMATAVAEPVRKLTTPTPPSSPPSPEEREATSAARAKLNPESQYNRYGDYTIVRYADGTNVSYRTAGSVFNSLEEATDFLDILPTKQKV